MNARDVSTIAPCPHCGDDLQENCLVAIQNWVPAADAPQGVPVADLLLTCDGCGALLNAFVPLSEFVVVHHD